jgi:hypothetical protein
LGLELVPPIDSLSCNSPMRFGLFSGTPPD